MWFLRQKVYFFWTKTFFVKTFFLILANFYFKNSRLCKCFLLFKSLWIKSLDNLFLKLKAINMFQYDVKILNWMKRTATLLCWLRWRDDGVCPTHMWYLGTFIVYVISKVSHSETNDHFCVNTVAKSLLATTTWQDIKKSPNHALLQRTLKTYALWISGPVNAIWEKKVRWS